MELPEPTPPEPDGLRWVWAKAAGTVGVGLLNDGRVIYWADSLLGIADPPQEPIVQMDIAGTSTTGDACGLLDDGSVRCWCAFSVDPVPLCERVPEEPGFRRVQHGGDGGDWACAEDAGGFLHCWGRRDPGRAPPDEPVLDWAIEQNGGCYVRMDGSVGCWGDIGFDNAPDAATEPPAELTYTKVAVGRNNGCALDTRGEVHCWGSTWDPVPFSQAPPGPWDQVFAWHQVACAIRDSDGTTACWHEETFAKEGDDDLWVVPDEKFSTLGMGEWSTCGVTLDGRAVCFPEAFDHAGEQNPPSLEDL